LICWVLVLAVNVVTMASHIIGGNIVLSGVSAMTGDATLSLHLIYDEISTGSPTASVVVSIFRKSDDVRIADFTLQREPTQEISFSNARCVGAQLAKIVLLRYSAPVTLSPSTYNDAGGYYIAWEQCCRNSSVTNLQNVRNTGLVFYTEIPPITLKNSSPSFKTPEVKYACRGQQFELDFGASDPDNDELKYSFITPLAGFTDAGTAMPPRPRQGPYPRAKWVSGYDSTRAVPSNNAMQIDAKTGKITLNPSRLGRYVFSVLCEESRGGRKIGETRRDFEVIVVDCVSSIPPPAIVEIKSASPSITFQTQPNGHTTVIELCQKDSVVLKANDENPQWAYQWQRDGKNIVGANQLTLSVSQLGNYTLVKRLVQGCRPQDTTFASTKVSLKNGATVKIVSTQKLPLCQGDSTNLSIQTDKSAVIMWQLNNENIAANSTTLFNIKKEGLYQVSVTDNNTKCKAKDSVIVKVAAAPNAQITASGPLTFCANDSVKLIANKQLNFDYIWFLDQTPLVRAIGSQCFPTQSGRYTVLITDTTSNCSTHSNALNVVVKPSPVVGLDSIPPLCGIGIQAVTLKGTPAGGTYSGKGVVGFRFVSQNNPPGNYPVIYSYTNSVGCTSIATRNVTVMPLPRMSLPNNLVILKGESIEIKTVIPENTTVRWFPSIGLSDATAARPTASPDRTTTYTVKITTPEGCQVEGEVTVTVISILIPNGFTPNADGANDSWEIEGIEQYPNCTVEIVNRWGGLLFKSKGYQEKWDGTWEGKPVPVGTYYYLIYLREIDYKLAGSLSVMR